MFLGTRDKPTKYEIDQVLLSTNQYQQATVRKPVVDTSPDDKSGYGYATGYQEFSFDG